MHPTWRTVASPPRSAPPHRPNARERSRGCRGRSRPVRRRRSPTRCTRVAGERLELLVQDGRSWRVADRGARLHEVLRGHEPIPVPWEPGEVVDGELLERGPRIGLPIEVGIESRQGAAPRRQRHVLLDRRLDRDGELVAASLHAADDGELGGKVQGARLLLLPCLRDLERVEREAFGVVEAAFDDRTHAPPASREPLIDRDSQAVGQRAERRRLGSEAVDISDHEEVQDPPAPGPEHELPVLATFADLEHLDRDRQRSAGIQARDGVHLGVKRSPEGGRVTREPGEVESVTRGPATPAPDRRDRAPSGTRSKYRANAS